MFEVAALIACVSLLYATVGQAGGTAFLAIMAFAVFPADEMRPTAQLLNIVAAGYATWRLHCLAPSAASASGGHIDGLGEGLGYFALVGTAYRSGEVSLAYPLMRGTAPLLLALVSSVVLGESLSVRAASGVVIICIGVLTMALAPRRSRADGRTIGFALVNAVVIATYTLVDGVGVRRSDNALAYTLAIFLASCVLFVPWVAWRHSGALAAAVRRHWHLGLAGGACIVLSYTLALWAMTRGPIAPVAALRETSILFGLLLARIALHERPSRARVAAGLLILAGAGALRLG